MTAGGSKTAAGQSAASEGAATIKLLEGLQTDLRTLCLQIKKKYPHIKEVSTVYFFKTFLYYTYFHF